jgi:hypothetical protein
MDNIVQKMNIFRKFRCQKPAVAAVVALLAASHCGLVRIAQADVRQPGGQDPLAQAPPPLGWSSWSSTSDGGGERLNEAYVKAQADVMAAKLKAVGFTRLRLAKAFL